MPYALTRLIWPLEKPVNISEKLGYIIDNPRTDEEYSQIRELVHKAVEKSHKDKMMAGLSLRASLAISNYSKQAESIEKESFAVDFFQTQKDVSTIELIIKSWIIIRFNDEGDFVRHVENKETFLGLVIQKENNSYTLAFEELSNFSHILSILTHDEESHYDGSSIMLSASFLTLFYPSEQDVYTVEKSIEHFIAYCFLAEHEYRMHSWLFWPDGKGQIFNSASIIENLLSKEFVSRKKPISQQQTPLEKLTFLGSLLKTASESNDLKVKLLLLVSAIEYLLTRNPLTDRFNVEDSISKQFKLKAAILIYTEGLEKNLETIKSNLEKIYSHRSDIAHGNYHANRNSEEYLNVVLQLHEYIRSILRSYLKDKNFVDFLKDN